MAKQASTPTAGSCSQLPPHPYLPCPCLRTPACTLPQEGSDFCVGAPIMGRLPSKGSRGSVPALPFTSPVTLNFTFLSLGFLSIECG